MAFILFVITLSCSYYMMLSSTIVVVYCLTISIFFTRPSETADEYGLYHFSFDSDALTIGWPKPKPLIFDLMYDFLIMIQRESAVKTQKCVLEGKGPGFTTPPGVARNIFAVMTMAYNTYARYSEYAQPATLYSGWTRMPRTQGQNKVPECVYIYGFYQIAKYLMPEQSAAYSLKQKYEQDYRCNLAEVSANVNSDLGLVQRDVDQLIAHLKQDGFNQDGCFADTTNFRWVSPMKMYHHLENMSWQKNENELSCLQRSIVFRQIFECKLIYLFDCH